MKFYKIILLTFLFLYSGQICFAGTSVDTLKSATYKKSRNHFVYRGWKYMAGDDISRAQPGYNDSLWQVMPLSPLSFMETGLPLNDFKGIAWFRFHVYIDSSLSKDTLSIYMESYGGTEVYLDGVRVADYGKVGTDASTEVCGYSFEPKLVILPVLKPGNHVFALRYSNFKGASKHLLKKLHRPIFICVDQIQSGTRIHRPLLGSDTQYSVYRNIYCL
ncbi:MAG: hypothetical protein IPP86_06570 [Bacteroidetes bacterium]|nr:hypothetical protein [Bacteroidota bacterium]